MSFHHHALRRQALLNALNALGELDPAASGTPVIDLDASQTMFETLCGEALMVSGGSGSEPIRPISPRTIASAMG